MAKRYELNVNSIFDILQQQSCYQQAVIRMRSHGFRQIVESKTDS